MTKELKIGFVAILTIAVLFVGLNYLKGLNVLNNNRNFHAAYTNVGGLKAGSPVLLNGYEVGMVSNVSLLTNDNQKILVTVSIEEDFLIPENTVLKIVNQDLMGTKSIDLVLGNSIVSAISGDTLVSGLQGSLQDEVNAQILPLKIKTEELISSIDSVMRIVTIVLDKGARENLSNSLKSLDQTFQLMAQTMSRVDAIVDQNDERISSIIKNLEDNNDAIAGILRNFSAISDDIVKSDIKGLLTNLSEISYSINDSEGSLGMLINDKDFYSNLENTSKELELLIRDIKENPRRYVGFSIIGGKSKSQKK